MDPNARMAALTASLKDVRSSLQQARRQQQWAMKDNSSLGCHALMDTAVRIMVVAEGRYPTAAAFLKFRMPRFEARSAKVRAVLEGRYAALTVAEMLNSWRLHVPAKGNVVPQRPSISGSVAWWIG